MLASGERAHNPMGHVTYNKFPGKEVQDCKCEQPLGAPYLTFQLKRTSLVIVRDRRSVFRNISIKHRYAE